MKNEPIPIEQNIGLKRLKEYVRMLIVSYTLDIKQQSVINILTIDVEDMVAKLKNNNQFKMMVLSLPMDHIRIGIIGSFLFDMSIDIFEKSDFYVEAIKAYDNDIEEALTSMLTYSLFCAKDEDDIIFMSSIALLIKYLNKTYKFDII